MRVPPLFAFAVCTLIWGLTWLGIKWSLDGVDPVWSSVLRFAVAAAILLALVAATRARWPRGRRAWILVLFVALSQFTLDYGLIYWAEARIDSGLAAILFASMPLFAALVGPAIHVGERAGLRHWAGLALSLVGLVAVFAPAHLGEVPAMLAVVAAAAAAAVGGIAVRRWGHDVPTLTFTFVSMAVGTVGLAATSLALGERATLPASARGWAAVFYLAIFGSVVGFLLYWDLLKSWPASRASLMTLLTPITALVTGVAVGERLTTVQWLGSSVVLGGVALALVRPGLVLRAVPSAAPK